MRSGTSLLCRMFTVDRSSFLQPTARIHSASMRPMPCRTESIGLRTAIVSTTVRFLPSEHVGPRLGQIHHWSQRTARQLSILQFCGDSRASWPEDFRMSASAVSKMVVSRLSKTMPKTTWGLCQWRAIVTTHLSSPMRILGRSEGDLRSGTWTRPEITVPEMWPGWYEGWFVHTHDLSDLCASLVLFLWQSRRRLRQSEQWRERNLWSQWPLVSKWRSLPDVFYPNSRRRRSMARWRRKLFDSVSSLSNVDHVTESLWTSWSRENSRVEWAFQFIECLWIQSGGNFERGFNIDPFSESITISTRRSIMTRLFYSSTCVLWIKWTTGRRFNAVDSHFFFRCWEDKLDLH